MVAEFRDTVPVHEHQAVCRECGEIITPELVGPDGTPTPSGWREIGKRLAAPIPTRNFKGKGGLTFDYITARQVQARLDQVVGPGNWSTTVQIVRAEHPVAALVSLRIFGVEKADVGYSNNPDADDPEEKSYEQEPLKAAVSDGFKRAAVQWGVARWLYQEMRTPESTNGAPRPRPVAMPTARPAPPPPAQRAPAPAQTPKPGTTVTLASADEPMWQRWLELKSEAERLGVVVPELSLPIAPQLLQAEGIKVREAKDKRREQLAREDAQRTETMVTAKDHPLWQEWLEAERKVRGAGLELDTSTVHLPISEAALRSSIQLAEEALKAHLEDIPF